MKGTQYEVCVFVKERESKRVKDILRLKAVLFDRIYLQGRIKRPVQVIKLCRIRKAYNSCLAPFLSPILIFD